MSGHPNPAATESSSEHGAHGGAAGEEAPAKKRKSPNAQLLRLKTKIVENFTHLEELFEALVSPDRPTRKMALFFFLSLATVVWSSYRTFVHFRGEAPKAAQVAHSADTHADAAHSGAHPQDHSAEAHATPAASPAGAAEEGDEYADGEMDKKQAIAPVMLTVGSFTLELKPRQTSFKKGVGSDLADVTLVFECDSQNTKDYLEQRLPQLKGQLTNLFIALDRDELITREGKLRLKAKIIDRVNVWLPQKLKITNVYFSRLTVG